MASIVPMILSAVIGQVLEKDSIKANSASQNKALQGQLAELKKRDQISAGQRRQKYKSLLAGERARLAGSGISSTSGLAGSVLENLVKRKQQEELDAGELSAMSSARISDKMTNQKKSTSRNLLQRVINKI